MAIKLFLLFRATLDTLSQYLIFLTFAFDKRSNCSVYHLQVVFENEDGIDAGGVRKVISCIYVCLRLFLFGNILFWLIQTRADFVTVLKWTHQFQSDYLQRTKRNSPINKGIFCNNTGIDTLISKRFSVESNVILSQLETQKNFSAVLSICNFQLREFRFVLYRKSL